MNTLQPASLQGWHPEDVIALRDPAVLINLGVDFPHRYDESPVATRENNNRRAGRALIGFNAYSERCHGDSNEPIADGLTDLIGDLQHLCDLLELDFDALTKRATDHYLCEIEGIES